MHVHWTSLKSMIDEDEWPVVSNEDNDTNTNFSRHRGGCPVGTTIACKYENDLCRVKVHNDNTMKCAVEKRLLPYGKRLRLIGFPSLNMINLRIIFKMRWLLSSN